MHRAQAQEGKVAPSALASHALAALLVHELDRDWSAVAIPRVESQLVVRFGPSVQGGLDVHAMGARSRVHRKPLSAGHWSVTARLRLGTQQAVLGVPASKITGRIVPLEDLWGDDATRRLLAQIARARGPRDAARLLESAIAEHATHERARGGHTQLALAAVDSLVSGNVQAVALDLGVSERHLRRVFRETIGVSPKAFARLARFRRAVQATREDRRVSWASIAARTGYYDQAHLISEFRAIAGATPRAFLSELQDRASLVTK